MSCLEGFIWGSIGGIALFIHELAVHLKERKSKRPVSQFYWPIRIFQIVIGGVVVVGYMRSGNQLNPILAINVGVTWPVVLGIIGGKSKPKIN